MSFLRRMVAVMVGSALGAGTVPGCSGRCHDSGDCLSGSVCAGPNEPPACGIPPQMACVKASDCSAGEVCNAVNDPCSPSGIGSQCDIPCTGRGCDVGLRCNAMGACEPVPCDEGFACSNNLHCDAAVAHGTEPVYDRAHGCVTTSCQADADCPSAMSCVNGVCETGPGTCEKEVAVP